jgi:hypothetical protein
MSVEGNEIRGQHQIVMHRRPLSYISQHFYGPVLLVLLIYLLSACQMFQSGADWLGLQPESGAENDPRSLGFVLFQDDFSDPGSGWDRVREDDGVRDYKDGRYSFIIRRPAWYFWATPNLNFTDVRIEVQAVAESSSGIDAFGVICRYQDAGNFYFFSITTDGFFGASKFENGLETFLGQGTMNSSPAIVQGAGTNHLGVECLGERLSFYVNGAPLLEVRDSSFSTGDVGLIATMLEGTASEIQFDNFSVLAP